LFRGAAAAGLSIALCLVAAPAFAGTTATKPTSKASPNAGAAHKPAHGSGHSRGDSGGGAPAVGNVPLPNPTQQCDPSAPAATEQGTPWAQQALDYSSAWQFSRGKGVTVAVIDSGVDANPQFGGRVSVGPTYAPVTSGAAPYADCVGHGTMVAGIIAAAPRDGTAFEGVAPDANILSIKVASGQTSQNGDQDTFSGASVASAIEYAVARHVQVINLSLTVSPPAPQLEAAVADAISQNIVVVASAGNDEPTTNSNGTTSTTTGPFYPASYPGVLSVGAVDGGSGGLADFSDRKTNVSVTAPGVNVTSTFPGTSGNAYAADSGTSFAAPFVSGVAALVRSRFPDMRAQQVVARIKETADGSAGPGTGDGLVNPLQAVTAVLPSGTAPTASASPGTGTVTVDRATPNRSEKTVALSLAGGAFAAMLLVIAAAIVIPAGRRRRWRPGEPS
jgi:type VII secretion-associated serine protease mycosin